MSYNPKNFQNLKIILHKLHISIDYNNFRLPYITPKPKQIVLMDTQLPPDTKIELAYAGIRDPKTQIPQCAPLQNVLFQSIADLSN